MQTPHDQTDQHWTDAKQFGEVALPYALAELPSHFSDIVVADFGLVRRRGSQSQFDGVGHVIGFRGPFEVIDGVVSLDRIDMVDLRKIQWVGDESHRNEAVHEESSSLSIVAQEDSEIFLGASEVTGKCGAYDLSLSPEYSSVLINGSSIQAAHAPKAADFITVAVSGDRNGSPFFNDSDIHVTGCLSGNGGTMIKDPSHASTSAGPAIMAALPDAYKGRPACRSH